MLNLITAINKVALKLIIYFWYDLYKIKKKVIKHKEISLQWVFTDYSGVVENWFRSVVYAILLTEICVNEPDDI